jgi:membrane associated rhomboid family serine protease
MTLNPINPELQFRECPACGNQTPAQSASCEHCGAPSIEAEIAANEAATETRFLRALFTRSNPFTMVFIGINVGVFVLMGLAGGFALMSVDPEVLRGFGAKQNNLIAEQHQYWRLITSIFIHIGFIHLFLNNYALWIIGQEIEQIYGSARFVVLYLVTGMLGSVGSYIFNPEATSAGASGAIFGLFGVMATFAFKYRKEIPALLSREIRRRVLPIIAINLVFGFSVSIVDNAAHIGGLLGGIALALAVPYMRPDEKRTPLVWRALQVICLVVIFVSFVSAFRNYNGPPLAVSNVTRRSASGVVTYFESMKGAIASLGEVVQATSARLKSRNEAADVRPLIDSVSKQIDQINSAPRVDAQSEQYKKRLLELLTEQKRILDEFEKEGAKNRDALAREEESLRNRFSEFLSDYNGWLPGFLKEHGYELGQSK